MPLTRTLRVAPVAVPPTLTLRPLAAVATPPTLTFRAVLPPPPPAGTTLKATEPMMVAGEPWTFEKVAEGVMLLPAVVASWYAEYTKAATVVLLPELAAAPPTQVGAG
jgi:hypothetical protein